MISVRSVMQDREDEINRYMEMMLFIHSGMQNGLPDVQNRNGNIYHLDSTHLHILTANIYLLLYNYIEAVVAMGINTVTKQIQDTGQPITAFTDAIQKEWVSGCLKLHDAKVSPETRLDAGVRMLKHFTGEALSLSISKGGGGNFHDETVHQLAQKLGARMRPNASIKKKLHKIGEYTYPQSAKNKDSCMKEITRERNKLAHGETTFQECGRGKSIPDLVEIKEVTFGYMHAFIDALDTYLNNEDYLQPRETTAP